MPRVVLKIGGGVPAAAAAGVGIFGPVKPFAAASVAAASADAAAADTLKCRCDKETGATCAFHRVKSKAFVPGVLSKDKPFFVERSMLIRLDMFMGRRMFHLCSFCEDDDKDRKPVYAAYCPDYHDERGEPHKHSAFMMCEGCEVSLCPTHAADGCLCDVDVKRKEVDKDEDDDNDDDDEEEDEEEEDQAEEPASKRPKH